jgi:sec-independent protein translocase protein TatB
MFDFDAGKFIIIGIVALIVIGPKDLPRVLRELGKAVGKMRRMAAEFQGQFMEAVREADMADIKADVAKLAESARVDVPFNPLEDIKTEIQGAIDKAAPSAASSAPASDLAAADDESASALLAFPHLSGTPSAAPPEKPGGEAAAHGAALEADADQSQDKGVDAEMKALASALKAEIEAAPQADPPHATDLLRRRSTLRDNA